MSFLQSLGGIINDQFGIGENTSHSLDTVSGGAYGRLGDYAKKFDQSAERTYIEDGFIRDIRPRRRSILFQQPDFYVVVKKRMFSTLIDNSKLDVLEEKERILIAATKRLFQNKCRILAAYEKLTKIEQLTFDSGRFNTFLGPALLDLIDTSNDLFTALGSNGLSPSTKSAIDTLRKVISYSEPGAFSNWTTNDYDAVFGKDIGEGPGTFELTNITSIKTTVSTEWGNGQASITLENPYDLLTIKEADIDQAITDVTNPMRTGSYYMFVENELQKTIDKFKADLAVERQLRGASQISFKTSPGTVLSKPVRAILDDEGVEVLFTYSTGINNFLSSIGNAKNISKVFSSVANVFSTGSVTIEPQFLAGNPSGNIGQNNQLTASERKKFEQIISDTFTQLSQHETSQRDMKTRNLKTNYARNRMRLFFNGKHIVQPMDTISIWMTSRTDEDARMPGGFKKQQNELGIGITQKFDTIIKNINSSINSMLAPTGTSYDDLERLSVVGPDMPKWLWRMFRQDITNQPTGPCIFSGLVGKGGQGVTGSWNDGKFAISFTCEDNTGYFDKSMVNFKPSSDVFNASIYDPLTPFDVSLDAATGAAITDPANGNVPPLLKENRDLLQSGMLIFRSGPNKGTQATENLYTHAPKEVSFDTWRSVLHDPEGLVYRWKQGIQSLTFTQRPNRLSNTEHERAVLLTAKPFAGQDVMNVISLLITGVPYNYDTFLKAAIENGNSLGGRDGLANLPSASTYIQGLLAEIERNNLIWGNFIPHKQLVVNEAAEQFIAQQRLDIVTKNSNLTQQLNELARTQDQLLLYQQNDMFQGAKVPASVDSVVFAKKIQALKANIQTAQTNFMNTISVNNPDVGLTVIGNDVNSDPLVTDTNPSKNQAQRQRDALQLRQRLFAMTARRFWQVRANQDKNLFIVDDQYDKNFDIMAFERKIGNKIDLFNSQYSNVGEQIGHVKKLLSLECFANTQGHIIVRPPGYNKVPSSVFYKMFKDRDNNGVKVFPDFLESLYFNQVKDTLTQIEVTEDNIRLRAIALGALTDQDMVNLINGNSTTGGSFNFLTSTGTGTNLLQFSQQSNPEDQDPNHSLLISLSNYQQRISNQVKNSKLFTASTQASVFLNQLNPSPDTQTSALEVIRNRLKIVTGTEPPTLDQLFSDPQFSRIGQRSQTSKLALITQIAQFVSQRQTLLKSALGAIRNLKDGVSVNAVPDLGAQNSNNQVVNAVVAPFLNRKTQIPQILEHMIEYEDEDDLGPGSGRRFILTADRIVSLTISENPPPFTMVSVNGLFGQGFTDPPGGLQTSNDGNAVTSAYAVDYDMWYQYGFRAPKSIEAPFFNDPNIQCAPYAVAALLEARENILQGSVGVVGYNEYYQPGDVVYIEDKNLLFYVKSVSHSFSYGNLSTTLELNYGHSPGEYIPTMLDIVGKVLYSSKGFFDQYRSERFEMLGSAKSLGALTFVSSLSTYTTPQGNDTRLPPSTDPLAALLGGRYGERNKNILSNILLYVSGNLNQQTFQNKKPFVKIVYYRTVGSFDSDMFNFATSVKDWLINPESSTSTGLSPIKFNTGSSGKANAVGLNPSDIVIEQVDFTDPANQTRVQVFPDTVADSVANTQGPSSAAVYAARACSVSTISPEDFRVFLANTVIDVFIDSKPIPVLSADSVGTARAAAAASSGAGAGAGSAAGAVQSASSSASAATAAAAAGAARNAAGGK
jgi:hypothetical protein